MISLAIGAVIGWLLAAFFWINWRTSEGRRLAEVRHFRKALESLQQPRLPNGRFKGVRSEFGDAFGPRWSGYAPSRFASWPFGDHHYRRRELMLGAKKFTSGFTRVAPFAEEIGNDDIKQEPMFFNSSFDFAMENGGSITQSFLRALPDDWTDGPLVFDSRVHMLMPGWYPAIPGYHHDDVPRPEIPVGQHFVTAGQPDYDNPRYRSQHIFGLVNADICPTEFAVGDCTMPEVPEGGLIYRTWHREVERLIGAGELAKTPAPDRTLIYFDCDAFHQGTKAVSNGWRWFGRISRNTERTDKITNEIRSQVQVYLEFPMEGW